MSESNALSDWQYFSKFHLCWVTAKTTDRKAELLKQGYLIRDIPIPDNAGLVDRPFFDDTRETAYDGDGI